MYTVTSKVPPSMGVTAFPKSILESLAKHPPKKTVNEKTMIGAPTRCIGENPLSADSSCGQIPNRAIEGFFFAGVTYQLLIFTFTRALSWVKSGVSFAIQRMGRRQATNTMQPGGVRRLAGFDAALANRLEFRDGALTGRVGEPILDRDGRLRALRRRQRFGDDPGGGSGGRVAGQANGRRRRAGTDRPRRIDGAVVPAGLPRLGYRRLRPAGAESR